MERMEKIQTQAEQDQLLSEIINNNNKLHDELLDKLTAVSKRERERNHQRRRIREAIKESEERMYKYIDSKLEGIESKLINKINLQLQRVDENINSLNQRVEKIETDCSVLSNLMNDVETLKAQQRKQENLNVACDLRVNGIPYNRSENLNEIFNNICNALQIKTPPYKTIYHIDIICISETWFTKYVADGFICVAGYNVFRNDRNIRTGGGVAIYVKSNISCKVIIRSGENEEVESIFIETLLNGQKLLIGCVYRPNKNIPINNFINYLTDAVVHYDDVIISGDMNSNIILDGSLINAVNSVGLYAVNSTNPTHFATTASTLLDLFLVNNQNKILLYDQLSASCFSKHDLIFMTYDVQRPPPEEEAQTFLNFKKINYHLLMSGLHCINWRTIYMIQSVDDKVDFLNRNLQHLQTLSVPQCTRKEQRAHKSWFNNSIQNLIKCRDIAYRRWKRFKTQELHNEFKALRSEVNKTIQRAKANHYSNRFQSAINSKCKWNIIREIGIGKSKFRPVNDDPDQINESFVSAVTTNAAMNLSSTSDIDATNFQPHTAFEFACTNYQDIVFSCMAIKSNAAGFDNIYPQLIKIILPHILPYITHLFNMILTTGNYPSAWKYAKIIPTPKTSDEYRPISILPFLSKVFERIIHNQISKYLNEENLLSSRQSGFRPKHSCITALIDVTEEIRSKLDDGLLSCLVLLDHSKAFDCVDHKRLCAKLLILYNFSHSASSLVYNYLCERSQSVVVGSLVSKPLNINRGVPQGSILGPLLFYLPQLYMVLQNRQRTGSTINDAEEDIGSRPPNLIS
ncbi:uncharacterized protein LOC142235586 [Haematobia irritans]|uniref:uncharacterized protein LOC142235586 n=1 Tax=Haematobia irritans TaxID=7368 RepID=UPI003F4FDF74